MSTLADRRREARNRALGLLGSLLLGAAFWAVLIAGLWHWWWR